jgi:hypothetical protein
MDIFDNELYLYVGDKDRYPMNKPHTVDIVLVLIVCIMLIFLIIYTRMIITCERQLHKHKLGV